jgi:hypothetical protein
MDYSLFDEAGRDYDAEAGQRRAALVRTAVSQDLMPFLALAADQVEYGHRRALASEGIGRIAARCQATPQEVADCADRMFKTFLDTRTASTPHLSVSAPCSNCRHASVDHSEGLRCSCGCTNFVAGSNTSTAARTEARRTTAEKEEGPFS